MKITKVNIPKTLESNDGLEDIKMDKLENIVLVAGKNGSGKTRILNKIFETFSLKPKLSRLTEISSYLEQARRTLASHQQQKANGESQLAQLPQPTTEESQSPNVFVENSRRRLQRQISEQAAIVSGQVYQIGILEKEQKWNFIETDEQSDNYSSVKFVPKSLNLEDCENFSKSQLRNFALSINNVGIDNLPRSTFAKIQVIQDRWFNSTHQYSQVPQEAKQEAIDDYERLQEIVKVFLDTEITRTINDEATLFGFPMGQANLSDGQKVLLQFCLAIYSQETSLNDLILVLDEPENHLHPSVIIETIERIQKSVATGQIWIATHSVPLLAHFDPSSIWYVEKNKIRHAGKIPEKVLHSLLGDEGEIAKLQDFISLPSQFASSRYAFESLFNPVSVNTNSNDPQSYQIRRDLLNHALNGKLRILDYGAGKGRLISNIVDLDESHQDKLIEKIDYIAYDKFSGDRESCESALVKAYGNCTKRYFNDFGNLLSVYDKGSFDVVIMCNVLHEIDPKDWLKLFRNDGDISSLLSDDGILLLVEDQQIPIGEKAYQKGFLVLDTPQLKDLFKITENDKDFTFTDKRGDGRLKAHQIPKRLLIQIDDDSRKAAIESMAKISKEKILEIREGETNYQNGKLHGFWIQQFANAELNLDEFDAR